MESRHSLEIVAVLALYFLVFLGVIGPAIEAATGFEMLSLAGPTGGAERAWVLVSRPQGWLLCLGYVPTHFAYLFVRARLAGESVDDYWESQFPSPHRSRRRVRGVVCGPDCPTQARRVPTAGPPERARG